MCGGYLSVCSQRAARRTDQKPIHVACDGQFKIPFGGDRTGIVQPQEHLPRPSHHHSIEINQFVRYRDVGKTDVGREDQLHRRCPKSSTLQLNRHDGVFSSQLAPVFRQQRHRDVHADHRRQFLDFFRFDAESATLHGLLVEGPSEGLQIRGIEYFEDFLPFQAWRLR